VTLHLADESFVAALGDDVGPRAGLVDEPPAGGDEPGLKASSTGASGPRPIDGVSSTSSTAGVKAACDGWDAAEGAAVRLASRTGIHPDQKDRSSFRVDAK
jgi:hypothetical protein